MILADLSSMVALPRYIHANFLVRQDKSRNRMWNWLDDTLNVRNGQEQKVSGVKLLIDGQLEDGDIVMDVINPVTEEVPAICPRASKALEKAVVAAKTAFPA